MPGLLNNKRHHFPLQSINQWINQSVESLSISFSCLLHRPSAHLFLLSSVSMCLWFSVKPSAPESPLDPESPWNLEWWPGHPSTTDNPPFSLPAWTDCHTAQRKRRIKKKKEKNKQIQTYQLQHTGQNQDRIAFQSRHCVLFTFFDPEELQVWFRKPNGPDWYRKWLERPALTEELLELDILSCPGHLWEGESKKKKATWKTSAHLVSCQMPSLYRYSSTYVSDHSFLFFFCTILTPFIEDCFQWLSICFRNSISFDLTKKKKPNVTCKNCF